MNKVYFSFIVFTLVAIPHTIHTKNGSTQHREKITVHSSIKEPKSMSISRTIWMCSIDTYQYFIDINTLNQNIRLSIYLFICYNNLHYKRYCILFLRNTEELNIPLTL